MIAVVIIDDHPVVRAGMRMVLDAAADIAVVAEGASGADALHLVAQHRPDVLVLEVQNYVSNIYGKLGVASRTEAALYAIRHRLVAIDPDPQPCLHPGRPSLDIRHPGGEGGSWQSLPAGNKESSFSQHRTAKTPWRRVRLERFCAMLCQASARQALEEVTK